jgi:hypothetical protein
LPILYLQKSAAIFANELREGQDFFSAGKIHGRAMRPYNICFANQNKFA